MARSSVCFLAVLAFRSAAPAQPAGSSGSWQGPVTVIAEDDFATGTSRTRVWMATGGERVEVDLPKGAPAPMSGQRLTVRGVRRGNRIAAASSSAGPAADPVARCAIPIGEQRVAVLLLEFPSVPFSTAGLTPSEFREVFFSTTQASLDGYWRDASYGKTWAAGDVFGPFALDRDYAYPDETWEGFNAAIRAADSTVDFRNYDRIYLVWPGGSGLGASGSVGCAGLDSPTQGFLPVSESIFSIGSPQPYEAVLSFAIHEAGHNLGLNHAAALDFAPLPLGPPDAAGSVAEYGDPFSQMGTARTANFPPQWLLGHPAAPHKSRLGWLERGNEIQDVESEGIFHLEPFESAGPGWKALRVRRGPESDKWLWLEYRQPVGYDQTLARLGSHAFTGVLVHYEDAAEDQANPLAQGRSYLLDFTAEATPHDFSDAALAAGHSWSDPSTPLTLLVTRAGESGLDVAVRYATPCASLSLSSQDHGWGAEAGSVEVSAPPDCNWTAASNADWITLTSPEKGSGPGTVTYELKPHSDPGLRTGTLFIGWRTFTITQASSWISPLPAVSRLTPRSGAGFSRTFKFIFSDPDDAGHLRYLQMFFRGRGDYRQCWVTIAPQDPALVLLKSAENPFTDAMGTLVHNGGSLQNSACAVDVSGIRLTPSGNYLTVELPVVFSANLSGPLLTWARADGGDGAHSDSSATPGTWTVPEGQCRSSVGSGFLFNAGAAEGAVNLTIDPGCPWMATSGMDWIEVSSGARGEGSGTVSYKVGANTGSFPRVGWMTIAGATMLLGQAGRGGGTAPQIAKNGILNGASLVPETGITSSSWFLVNGLNLSDTTRSWRDSDFAGNQLPIQLDGVSVLVNGKPAYVRRIGPMQIEALAPDLDGDGPVAVEVATPQGRSNGVMVSKQKFAPAFFFKDVEGRRYVDATRVDGTPAGSPFDGPVKPGETIRLTGTGFGPTIPACPAGEIVAEPARIQFPPDIRIGNVSARIVSAALVASGAFQFEVVVPEVGDGDHPVVAEIGLSITPGGVYVTVGR